MNDRVTDPHHFDRNVVKLAQTDPLWTTHHFYTSNARGYGVEDEEWLKEDEHRDGV